MVVNGRDADKLRRTAEEIRKLGPGQVAEVVSDITAPGGREELLAACTKPDILVTNNSGPRPGNLDDITEDDLTHALQLHYYTPIAFLEPCCRACAREVRGDVNITSAMVTTAGRNGSSAGTRTGSRPS